MDNEKCPLCKSGSAVDGDGYHRSGSSPDIPHGFSRCRDLAQFRHHPDPATDFCIEVDELVSIAHDRRLEIPNPGDDSLEARIAAAMGFAVGGDDKAVAAKRTLRVLEGRVRPRPQTVRLRSISEAKKDRTPILIYLKNPIPEPGRDDLRTLDGIVFVGRHQGLADDGFDVGWNFAAPVGYGGIPDEWIEGWLPIPAKENGE